MNGLIVMVLMQQTTYCRVGKVRRLGFLMVEDGRQPDIRRSIGGSREREAEIGCGACG